mmetsp:Transcript_14025/g.60055  ORF Transcript_14025/g.60055 Transcript_14025/m.60055 type:complete len:225 (+) Transcript_14025:880-1554(+)
MADVPRRQAQHFTQVPRPLLAVPRVGGGGGVSPGQRASRRAENGCRQHGLRRRRRGGGREDQEQDRGCPRRTRRQLQDQAPHAQARARGPRERGTRREPKRRARPARAGLGVCRDGPARLQGRLRRRRRRGRRGRGGRGQRRVRLGGTQIRTRVAPAPRRGPVLCARRRGGSGGEAGPRRRRRRRRRRRAVLLGRERGHARERGVAHGHVIAHRHGVAAHLRAG